MGSEGQRETQEAVITDGETKEEGDTEKKLKVGEEIGRGAGGSCRGGDRLQAGEQAEQAGAPAKAGNLQSPVWVKGASSVGDGGTQGDTQVAPG